MSTWLSAFPATTLPMHSLTRFQERYPAMTTITIDGKEYEYEALSDKAKAQLTSMQFVDNELARLQAQASVLQTARMAYSKELQNELNPLGSGDTIKF